MSSITFQSRFFLRTIHCSMTSIVICLLILFSGSKANGQVDPHFSQYYMYPHWLNPALTGAINGNYRVGIIHRNQWSGITNAFSTIGLSGDLVTDKKINFGINILRQTAGDAGYGFLDGKFSMSYAGVRFGREGKKIVSFGMQGGFVNRRFDYTKLKAGTQFKDFFGYDPGLPIGESYGKTSATVLDLGAGAFYYDEDPDKKVNFFGGFSASHLNRPRDNFFTYGQDVKWNLRYNLHAGAKVMLSENTSIVPNMVYVKQAAASEFMIGGYFQFMATEDVDFMTGANYRLKDAVYPYLGFNFNNLMIGVSYDVNASSLGQMAKGANSYEFSLMYSDRKGTDKGFFKCPRF